MKPVYLLIGKPGTGKTSLIKQALAELEIRAGGFYTEEIREGGTRLGFRLVTLDGQEMVLSHVDFPKRFSVSKYGVDVEGLEKVGITAIKKAAGQDELVVIDEIGKMELFSDRFREAVLEIISSGHKVLGTILAASHPWADAIKKQSQVNLVTLTRASYPQVLADVRRWLEFLKLFPGV